MKSLRGLGPDNAVHQWPGRTPFGIKLKSDLGSSLLKTPQVTLATFLAIM